MLIFLVIRGLWPGIVEILIKPGKPREELTGFIPVAKPAQAGCAYDRTAFNCWPDRSDSEQLASELRRHAIECGHADY